jgi:hypothetical protein
LFRGGFAVGAGDGLRGGEELLDGGGVGGVGLLESGLIEAELAVVADGDADVRQGVNVWTVVFNMLYMSAWMFWAVLSPRSRPPWSVVVLKAVRVPSRSASVLKLVTKEVSCDSTPLGSLETLS